MLVSKSEERIFEIILSKIPFSILPTYSFQNFVLRKASENLKNEKFAIGKERGRWVNSFLVIVCMV
jgi:hypothetical protein